MREHLATIKSSLSSKTGRATLYAIAGQFGNGAAGFVLNVILIRQMSIDEYGTFSLFNSAMMILAAFTHMGWLETFIRYGSQALNGNRYDDLRRVFFLRIFKLSLAMLVLVTILAKPVATTFYHRPEFAAYIVAAGFAAFTTTIQSLSLNDLRIRSLFGRFVAFQLGTSAVRLAGCSILAILGILSAQNTTVLYTVTPLLFGASALLWLAPKGSQNSTQNIITEEHKTYNRWILVACVTHALTGPISTIFLARYYPNSEISAFGATARLTLPVYFIISAMGTTMLPKLSAMPDERFIKEYLRRLAHFAAPMVLFIVAMFWLMPPLLGWIAGSKYDGLDALMRWQIAAVALAFLSTPVSFVWLAWGWSRANALLNVLLLAVNVTAGYFLIKNFGAIGAAATTCAVGFVSLVCVYAGVWLKLRNSAA